MNIQFKGSLPKDFAYKFENEDAMSYAPSRGIAVISDGATESFNSRKWSRILVKRFRKNQRFNYRWITSAIRAYYKHLKFGELSWSRQAAFLRGSFATLLGVVENPENNSVDVLSIGDSLAVLIQGESYVDSTPYKNSLEFDQRPELISTNALDNSFLLDDEAINRHKITWKVGRGSKILLMTDALGAWCLKKAEESQPEWSSVSCINNLSELRNIVTREREARNLRPDDTSLIILTF